MAERLMLIDVAFWIFMVAVFALSHLVNLPLLSADAIVTMWSVHLSKHSSEKFMSVVTFWGIRAVRRMAASDESAMHLMGGVVGIWDVLCDLVCFSSLCLSLHLIWLFLLLWVRDNEFQIGGNEFLRIKRWEEWIAYNLEQLDNLY